MSANLQVTFKEPKTFYCKKFSHPLPKQVCLTSSRMAMRGAENHRGKLDEMERQPWKGGTWAGRKDLKKIKNTRTIKTHTGKVKSRIDVVRTGVQPCGRRPDPAQIKKKRERCKHLNGLDQCALVEKKLSA